MAKFGFFAYMAYQFFLFTEDVVVDAWLKCLHVESVLIYIALISIIDMHQSHISVPCILLGLIRVCTFNNDNNVREVIC